MTDPTDLIAQADAALDGVTEGPWHAMGDGDLDGWFIGGGGYVRANTVGPPDERGPNARFIAASRQLVPALRDALAAALARAEAAECHAEALEAERDRLRVENARLREALTPIHDAARDRASDAIEWSDVDTVAVWVTIGDLRRARAALTGEPQR